MIVGLVLVAVAVISALVIVMWKNSTEGGESTNGEEPERWAMIEDEEGDRMAVVATRAWAQLVEMNKSGTIKYVGGVIEEYDNEWGFRFNPNSTKVYSLTGYPPGFSMPESTIREISQNLNAYLDPDRQVVPFTYIKARVVEIYGS